MSNHECVSCMWKQRNVMHDKRNACVLFHGAKPIYRKCSECNKIFFSNTYSNSNLI